MKKNSLGAGLGSSTLVMLFSVLCLTVFAVLSFSSAKADLNLSERYVESVEGYYEADIQATRILGRLKSSGDPVAEAKEISSEGIDIGLNEDGNIVFTWPIDANLALNVELDANDEALGVLSWNLEEISDWIPDYSIDIWGSDSLN